MTGREANVRPISAKPAPVTMAIVLVKTAEPDVRPLGNAWTST
jgi:hypothetical protein